MRRLLLLSLLFATLPASAGPVFELKDGTRVRGEIVTLDDGVYTVRSETLGRVEIRQQDIDRIDYGKAPKGASLEVESSAQIQSLQRDLAADGEIFALIQQLQADPQLQQILADPEIMRAVAAGDLNALIDNPKFMKLLENPNIRAITSKVTAPRETR